MGRHPDLKLYMGDHHGPRGDMYRADDVDRLLSTLRAERDGLKTALERIAKANEKHDDYYGLIEAAKTALAPRGQEGGEA